MLRTGLLILITFYSAIASSFSAQESDPASLKMLADNYLINSRYDSAVIYYSKAASEFLELSDIQQYLYCKNQEAFALGFQNHTQEALSICEKIINEYPDSLRAYRYDAYFFWKMALFNIRLGNFNKAFTYGVKAKEIAESYSIFTDLMLNDLLDILTTSARYIGLYDIGLGYSFERMKYNQSRNDFLNLSHSYNNIALIYKRYRDQERAIEYFKMSMELREKYAPQWTPYVTTNIGEMYNEFGQTDSALSWFQNTLKILRDQGVRENLLYSVIYSSISVINSKNGDLDSARIYIDKCLDIRSRYFRADDIHFTEFQFIKADILINSGELSAAYDIMMQLKELYQDEDISPQNRYRYHLVMANWYKTGGRKIEALQEYQQAIVILSRDFEDMDLFELPGQNDFFYDKDKLLRTVNQKAGLINNLYIETGDSRYLRSVTDHYNFSLHLIKMMIDDQSGLESVSNLYKDYSDLYETAISASVSLNELDPGEKNYSNISSYMEASRMNHAKILYRLNQVINYGGIPDSVVNRKAELERIIASGVKDSVEAAGNLSERSRLEQELDRIQLLLKNENRNNELIQTDNFDLLSQARRKLNRKEMILQYYFGKEKLYLLATTKLSNRFLSLPWADQEKQDLDHFISHLKAPGQDSTLAELNRRVFHSLGLDSILTADIHEIIVIPDRELYFIPFDALRDENNEFLISNYTIYTENSLFFMNADSKRVKSNNALLALAPFSEIEPRSSVPEDATRYGNIKFSPLPGSKNEVETIQKLLGGIVSTGSSATEEFFRENANNSRIIHLSSHSYLDDTDPLFNSIVFSPGTGDEDGYLYTHELYSLNLSADLVTLSACNTGIGRYLDGEGMISLSTGFRSAGVHNIVMSLWNLPDDATSEVMINFYSYLKGGAKKADALRLAKLDYLEGADQNASSPYFWAASVLTGTNSPVQLRNSYIVMAAGLVAGSICILLIIRNRKRRKKK